MHYVVFRCYCYYSIGVLIVIVLLLYVVDLSVSVLVSLLGFFIRTKSRYSSSCIPTSFIIYIIIDTIVIVISVIVLPFGYHFILNPIVVDVLSKSYVVV